MNTSANSNTYNGIIDEWKMDIVSAIANRMGLPPDAIDDAQQEVAIQLLKRSYDTQKSNGASEATLVGIIARNIIQKMRRGSLRYADRIERLKTVRPPAEDVVDATNHLGETWMLVATMKPDCQQVAALLAEGLELNTIANRLGWRWDRVRRVVDELRRSFTRAGLAPG